MKCLREMGQRQDNHLEGHTPMRCESMYVYNQHSAHFCCLKVDKNMVVVMNGVRIGVGTTTSSLEVFSTD